jgi:HKD family nuclease
VGEILREAIRRAEQVEIASAFVKESGLSALIEPLEQMLQRGGPLVIIYGLDFCITDSEAAVRLLRLSEQYGQLEHYAYSAWNLATSHSFHPKLYIMRHDGNQATVVVGSSNLTRGGLWENIEANAVLVGTTVDQPIRQALDVFQRIRAFDGLFVPSEAYLEAYKALRRRALRTMPREKPPRELAPAYRLLKQKEELLPGTVPTQKRLIVDAIKSLRRGPSDWIHIDNITRLAEARARALNLDFKWDTFSNSLRGRFNSHTVGKGGDDLFERRGGVSGRFGQYRLTERGESYQGR